MSELPFVVPLFIYLSSSFFSLQPCSFLFSLPVFLLLPIFYFYLQPPTNLQPITSLQPPFPFFLPYCPPCIFHPPSFTSHHFTIPPSHHRLFTPFHYRLCSPCLFHFIVYSLWSVEVYLYISDSPVMGRRVRVSVFSGYTRMGDYIGIMPL